MEFFSYLSRLCPTAFETLCHNLPFFVNDTVAEDGFTQSRLDRQEKIFRKS
jgi:hypothetical protein